jgi:hypothetical protein
MREHKKLYRVKVEYQICVLAENIKEAVAITNSPEALEEVKSHTQILCEIKNLNAVPNRWLDKEPYSIYSHLSRLLKDKTVREILTRRLTEPFNREKERK